MAGLSSHWTLLTVASTASIDRIGVASFVHLLWACMSNIASKPQQKMTPAAFFFKPS